MLKTLNAKIDRWWKTGMWNVQVTKGDVWLAQYDDGKVSEITSHRIEILDVEGDEVLLREDIYWLDEIDGEPGHHETVASLELRDVVCLLSENCFTLVDSMAWAQA